jgi:hypothetical protein
MENIFFLFDRNTFANLENISCSIKDKCSTGHAPWPKGNNLFEIIRRKKTYKSYRYLYKMSTESCHSDASGNCVN